MTNLHRTLFWGVVTLILCVFIFGMSASDGTASSGMSARVAEMIASITVPDFGSMPATNREEIIAGLQLPVRKCAHFTEYAALGISILNFALSLGMKKGGKPRRAVAFALVFCVLYAAIDEAHQLLVPGRSGNPLDVLVDTTGALVGIAIARAWTQRKRQS